MSKLPSGWVLARIDEANGIGGLSTDGDWIESKDQDPNGEVRLIQLQDIGDGHFLDKSARFLTKQRAEELNCTFLQEGDILIARMPDPLGRACVFPRIHQEAITAVDVHVWRPGEMSADPNYLKYCVNSPQIRLSLQSQAGGTTRQRVAGGKVKAQEIPLPPPAEQKRIVRKLDTLSASTSSTRADLTAIAKLVERYRNSVLEIAFKGALTAEWRAICEIDNSASAETKKRLERQRSALSKKNEKPRRPRTAKADHHRVPVELPIPEDWALTTMEDISSPLRLIQYGILKPGPDEAGGVPYVKVMNIKGGVVEPEKIRHTTKEIHQQYMRSSLKTGDLLLTIRGTVGRMAFVPESLNGGNITQDTVRIDLLDGMNSNFVFWYFHSPQAQKYFQENQKGVAVRGINVGDVRPMEVPLPSRLEQDEIAKQIETAFAKIDRLAAEAEKALKLTDRLDERILAKAFAGELVPQDPIDEPASVLLDRIREARANAPKKTRPRRTKATAMKKDPKDVLLADSAKWPANGVSYEELSTRIVMPHDDLRDAMFDLLGGTNPKLVQFFDSRAQRMRFKQATQ